MSNASRTVPVLAAMWLRQLWKWPGSQSRSLQPRLRNYSTSQCLRSVQLEKLNQLASTSDEFNAASFAQVVRDFLAPHSSEPDIGMASKLLQKFVLKGKVRDDSSLVDLCSLLVLKAAPNEASDFLMRWLQASPEGSSKNKLPRPASFLLDHVWEGIFEGKDDATGLRLYQHLKGQPEWKHSDAFVSTLIIRLFLPRLNWEAVDACVHDCVSQSGPPRLTLPSECLTEIFRVVLKPEVEDQYADAGELLGDNVIQPRFHQLLKLLRRWQDAGTPLKGPAMARAFELLFHDLLPTQQMLEELRALA